MLYKRFTYQEKDKVGIIELGDPADTRDKKIELRSELLSLREKIALDGRSRVIILKGSTSTSFCMEERLTEGAPPAGHSKLEEPISISDPMAEFDLPVIAAVPGDAMGQGLELLLACDIRIATNSSRFGFPQIRHGLIPMDGGTQRLSRLVGMSKAMEMILTGSEISAEEGYRIGLVNKIVPAEKLSESVLEMAQMMASKGPASLRYAKEAICKGMDLTLEQGLRLEADLYFLLHTTMDRTEGVKAFQEKRKAEFKGQ